jgi:hypothetical protein
MFNSPVIDLVILLSFTYFIGSLILSALNESIAGTFRLRQEELKKGINKFFLDSHWRAFVKNIFIKSPHIQTLMKKEDKFPVYIPARNFVLAIVQHLDGNAYKSGNIVSNRVKDIDKQDTEKDILPDELVIVLKTIMKQVSNLPPEQIIYEFEQRLEVFFNNSMDRVTGWYKRRVRRILLILGFSLSVVLNIDTIKICNDAIQDRSKLSNAVDNISSNILKFDTLQKSQIRIKDSASAITVTQTKDGVTTPVVVYEQTTGYKLGYNTFDDFKRQWKENFWKKLLGILLTAFALQLGSNYWFDMMNKAVNVRAAGKRPVDIGNIKPGK